MLFFELIAIAVFVSCATVLPGVFLVLRKTALVSDAVSHAVLFGIATLFLVTGQLHSVMLLIGAVFSGLLAVVAIEFLMSHKFIKSDAAMGIVFPLFFSLGVLLISKYAYQVHLDTDMVMLGELAFAPLTRCIFYGNDCGPMALWTLGFLIVVQVIFVGLFYKELLVATWDKEYAWIAGLRPRLFYYLIVLLTSLTAVLSFESVGSIVVVALMITPAATALLVARTMSAYIGISFFSAIFSAVVGTMVGWFLNISLAGCIAAATGFVFIATWLWSLLRT